MINLSPDEFALGLIVIGIAVGLVAVVLWWLDRKLPKDKDNLL